MIRLRAQTCMDSKVVRADFGSGLICPKGSNMLRRAAQTCSACKLAEVQIIPLPTLANQILARTFFRFRLTSVCVSSRWKVLSGEFRRRPTSLAIKSRKPDRVGRRGLSEPREDFSRLNTDVFPPLHPPLIWGLFQTSPTHALVSLRYFTRPGAVFSPSRRTRSSSYSEKFPLKKNV